MKPFKKDMSGKVVIMVHGGAWKIPDSIRDDTVRGVGESGESGL